MGQIKIKDHLSPAEAEVGAEIGNRLQIVQTSLYCLKYSKIKIKDHLSPTEIEIGAELGNISSGKNLEFDNLQKQFLIFIQFLPNLAPNANTTQLGISSDHQLRTTRWH